MSATSIPLGDPGGKLPIGSETGLVSDASSLATSSSIFFRVCLSLRRFFKSRVRRRSIHWGAGGAGAEKAAGRAGKEKGADNVGGEEVGDDDGRGIEQEGGGKEEEGRAMPPNLSAKARRAWQHWQPCGLSVLRCTPHS